MNKRLLYAIPATLCLVFANPGYSGDLTPDELACIEGACPADSGAPDADCVIDAAEGCGLDGVDPMEAERIVETWGS